MNKKKAVLHTRIATPGEISHGSLGDIPEAGISRATAVPMGDTISEEYLLRAIRYIIDEFPFVAMVIDEDHTILVANKMLLQMVGGDEGDIIGRKCPELVHGLDGKFPGCPLQEAVETGHAVEKQLLDPFYQAWISSAIYPLPFTSRGKKVFIHTAQDITRRKEAELTIQRQKENLEHILESISHPFYIINVDDYTVTLANSSAGFKQLNENSKCYRLTHNRNTPCDSLEHACPIQEIKRTKKPVTLEHIHYDNRIIEIHGYPIIGKDGNVNQIIEYTFDITDKKKAEKALFESEEKFLMFVETIPSMLIITDTNYHNVYISPNCGEITGYTPEELLGRFIWWEQDDTTSARELFERSFRKKGVVRDYEYNLVKKNGETWYAYSSWRPLRGVGGTLIGFIIQTLDITKRKQTEKQLLKAKKELELKSTDLEEKNIALKTLLNFHDKEKQNSERNILSNIKTLVSPYIAKLESTLTEKNQLTLLNIINVNLAEITKPFSNQLMNQTVNLSFTESQVANLIYEGKTTKEISVILYISEHTVQAHNRNIRSKLGIKNKKINLRSYLQTFLKK